MPETGGEKKQDKDIFTFLQTVIHQEVKPKEEFREIKQDEERRIESTLKPKEEFEITDRQDKNFEGYTLEDAYIENDMYDAVQENEERDEIKQEEENKNINIDKE